MFEHTYRSSVVAILTNLAKIGTLPLWWLWTVAPGCCHFQSFFSYLWTGCPELLYPLLTFSLPLICSTVQRPPSLPPSLHFTLFTSAHLAPRCPAQSSGEEPSRWRLTSPLFACLGSAHGTVKRKTLGLRGEIFAKLLYLSVFSSWFPFEAFSNVEWCLLDLIS